MRWHGRLLLLSLFIAYAAIPVSAFDFFGLFGSSSKKSKKPDPPPVSDDKAKEYLQNFGYVAPSHVISSSQRGSLAADFDDVKNALKSAIRRFQDFAGLKTTGELDAPTKKKMAEPRCGVVDVQAISSTREAAFKWKKQHLTYSIFTYSTDLPRDDIKRAIRKAFDTWSAVVPLDFTEVQSTDESADIKIKFASNTHGDPWPFDGPGGVLAHATMPTSGLLHFDEAENWVYMNAEKISNGYTDLYAVAVHESGHTLGLGHSRDDESIMAPFYHETVDKNGNYIEPKLKTSDISDIQDIYGRRTGAPPPKTSSGSDSGWGWDTTTTPRPTPRTTTRGSRTGGRGGMSNFNPFGSDSEWSVWPPSRGGGIGSGIGSGISDSGSDLGDRGRQTGGSGPSSWDPPTRETEIGNGGLAGSCPHRLDAITSGIAGSKYLISGGNVFEMVAGHIIKTHSLRLLFPKGPVYVDAALANERTQTILLFQGYNVYSFKYTNGKWVLDSDFPKRVPRDMGFRPDGAIVWIDGHQILFSNQGKFAVYDEYWNQATKVDSVSNFFPDTPETIKGGFSSSGNEMTLFSEQRVYTYDARRKIGTGQPQSLTAFLRCS